MTKETRETRATTRGSRAPKNTLKKRDKPAEFRTRSTSSRRRSTASAELVGTTSAPTRRRSTTSAPTKINTRDLTSKEKDKREEAEKAENAAKEAEIEKEKIAIAHAKIKAREFANDINTIVVAASTRMATAPTSATTPTSATPMRRQSTLIQDQKEEPLCIPYATSRAMVNIIFPQDKFDYLTPNDRLDIMDLIIPYLGLPPDNDLNFDGKLIPDFVDALIFELNELSKINNTPAIPNISMDGISVQGELPVNAVPALKKLLESQPFTDSDHNCTSPLWDGVYGDCYYFDKYIVVYVILPKKSSDFLYGLRYKSTDTDKKKYQSELIKLSKQNYDITYDAEKGIYYTKFIRDKRRMATVGHALVIKGYRLDPATGLITHLLVRNSWGDCEDPTIGGYWVPIEFFDKNTYAAFRFI